MPLLGTPPPQATLASLGTSSLLQHIHHLPPRPLSHRWAGVTLFEANSGRMYLLLSITSPLMQPTQCYVEHIYHKQAAMKTALFAFIMHPEMYLCNRYQNKHGRGPSLDDLAVVGAAPQADFSSPSDGFFPKRTLNSSCREAPGRQVPLVPREAQACLHELRLRMNFSWGPWTLSAVKGTKKTSLFHCIYVH